jgi:hypothetical protein
MQLSDDQIREIAGNMDVGMRSFYHLKTGEIEAIPDFEQLGAFEGDKELWQELLDKLDENSMDYFEFEKITSRESFEIMADYAETVDNQRLQERLYHALNRSKPFQNFKWEIDNSGEYRQRWFDFKNQRLFEFVQKQIDRYNCSLRDE